MQHLRLTVLILVSCLVLASCGGKVAPLVDIEDAPLKASSTASLDTIAQAIERAGTRRGWQMTAKSPGAMSGKIMVRGKHTVIVDVIYDTETVSILYGGSINMNYSEKNGVRRIHPSYLKWIEFLKKDIQREVEGAL